MKVIASKTVTAALELLNGRYEALCKTAQNAEERGDVEWVERINRQLAEYDSALDEVVALQVDGTGHEFGNELISSHVDDALQLAVAAAELGKDVIVAKLDEDETDEVAYYFIGTETEIFELLKDRFAKFLQ